MWKNWSPIRGRAVDADIETVAKEILRGMLCPKSHSIFNQPEVLDEGIEDMYFVRRILG